MKTQQTQKKALVDEIEEIHRLLDFQHGVLPAE